jgi:tRNA dimethylallyltransferase
VGKTSAGIRLAARLGTEILSADSRQFFKELRIGSAMPTTEEMARVKHHFIGHLSIHDTYNVSRYELDALQQLEECFTTHDIVLMVGGSGLYLDAVCDSLDEFPDADPLLRKMLNDRLASEGIVWLQQELLRLDPEYHQRVDLQNPSRLIRALEVCLSTGQPYSTLRGKKKVERPFNIIKVGLELPKEILMERIRLRTHAMMHEGLVQETQALYPFRALNALNTVGYKEIFQVFDNKMTEAAAVEKIITNTWRYAKRQLTWFRKDQHICWFRADNEGTDEAILQLLNKT